MRLHCRLDELCEYYDYTKAELAAATGIGARTLDKMRADDDEWRLSRTQIEKLTVLARGAGLPHAFVLRANPVWATFEESSATIFRGEPPADAMIESKLSDFLQQMNGHPRTKTIHRVPSEAEIRKAMTETNCIFVGSPRSNPATEIALCLLSGARPFDGSAGNRVKVPVHIIGADSGTSRDSAIVLPGRGHGFSIDGGDGSGRKSLDVHWVPAEDYAKKKVEGRDAGVVVLCKSPFGTKKNVTTILLLGYRGLATHELAAQLMRGAPPITEEMLRQHGRVHVLGYHFSFHKPRGAAKGTADMRKARQGEWAPPWP